MRQRGWRRLVKRAVDSTVAGSVLLASAPVLVGTTLAVRATMGSPVLFKQKRPGLGGKPFEVWKFRTMRDLRAGERSPDDDAARITRFGAFMRKTSLDELPQLMNVLRGEMSIIGPRPLLMRYLDRYTVEQARRHDVLPGLTGWAQVNGRNALSWEKKFELDVWYVDNWSLALDAKVLVKTLGAVVRQDGISSAEHVTMQEFLGSPT